MPNVVLNPIELTPPLTITLALMGCFLLGTLTVLGLNRARSSRWGQTASTTLHNLYTKILAPHLSLVWVVCLLAVADVAIVVWPLGTWSQTAELCLSLGLTLTTSWLASRLFKQFFDAYLLDLAFKNGRKINSELLILTKVLANTVTITVAVIAFAQTHQINILGLIASLGIGGLSIAFAAQKTLEQLLGGIVLYIDRPFVVDDYIGLPDGTFGRVETIGLRSTKIRASGKGTLVIVPNNALTQSTIENFTGAKKVMAIVYLHFLRPILPEERALITQVIIESSQDIFGIDPRNTDVSFRQMPESTPEAIAASSTAQTFTQAQITFFILGSGDVSMELRRQVLDIATQTITTRLREYGIAFEIEAPTIYVDSPITI